jgi:hypothetical protein
MKKKVKEENAKHKKEVYPADAYQHLKDKGSKWSAMRILAGFAPMILSRFTPLILAGK